MAFSDPEQLQRHRAFFNREPAERPLLGCHIGFYMHQAFPTLSQSLPRGPITSDDIRVDLFLEDCERLYRQYCEMGDDYPFMGAPFIYVPWMEAILGCPIVVLGESMSAQPVVEDWDAWHWEPPALDSNQWARKLLELMQALVEHSNGRYPVTHTMMRGPADLLSALRGATCFPLDFFDCPDTVRRALALFADIWVEVAQAQLDLVPESPSGYFGSGYYRAWAPDKIIWLQEDAAALLSPTLYREFVLPHDRRIASQFPYAAFHLHGSVLWSVDDLVAAPELDIIQLNHESAYCDVEGTFAAWKRIQKRKPLVVWKEFDGPQFWPWLDRVLMELSPRGLSLIIVVASVEEGLAVKARVIGDERGGA